MLFFLILGIQALAVADAELRVELAEMRSEDDGLKIMKRHLDMDQTYGNGAATVQRRRGEPEWTQKGNDLVGEEDGGYFGWSVDLSADGLVMAVGADGNDGNGQDSGHVRVFEWDGDNSAWAQLGNDIDGEAQRDGFGHSVALSDDGSILAIGAIGNDDNGSSSGHVRVFEWNSSAWTQRGGDIDGEAEWDYSGQSIALSADGSIVAIGAYLNDGNGDNSGHVRVYEWSNSAWTQRGSDIDGEAAGDQSGLGIALSADGGILAIGAPQHDNNRGHVRVYEWSNSAWTQLGDDIDGEAEMDWSGYKGVALSADGSIVAIGAWNNQANGAESGLGHVRVYEWSNSAWTQRGSDIDGDAAWAELGTKVALSADGSVVAIGAPAIMSSEPGFVRVYDWNDSAWVKRGNDMTGVGPYDDFGHAVALSNDGSIVAIGADYASNGYGTVQVYEWPQATNKCASEFGAAQTTCRGKAYRRRKLGKGKTAEECLELCEARAASEDGCCEYRETPKGMCLWRPGGVIKTSRRAKRSSTVAALCNSS